MQDIPSLQHPVAAAADQAGGPPPTDTPSARRRLSRVKERVIEALKFLGVLSGYHYGLSGFLFTSLAFFAHVSLKNFLTAPYLRRDLRHHASVASRSVGHACNHRGCTGSCAAYRNSRRYLSKRVCPANGARDHQADPGTAQRGAHGRVWLLCFAVYVTAAAKTHSGSAHVQHAERRCGNGNHDHSLCKLAREDAMPKSMSFVKARMQWALIEHHRL